MRTLGLSLCLVACTLDNPAFQVTQTDPATSAASTLGTDSDASGTTGVTPTTSSSISTSASTSTSATSMTSATSASSTGPDVTSDDPVTSQTATSMHLTDSTTSEPMTSSTTDPGMTSTTDPNETTTGPMMCVAFADQLGPFTRLQALPNLSPVLTEVCAPMQGVEFGGRLDTDNAGLIVNQDGGCFPNNLPVQGVRIFTPLPPAVYGDSKCVTLTFQIHPDYVECTLSAFVVRYADDPIIVGSFGNAGTPPNMPFQVAHEPKGLCTCPGCCDDGPDPDIYKLLALDAGVSEMTEADVLIANFPWKLINHRSHVHHPACTGDVPTADWLHFDWTAARVPG